MATLAVALVAVVVIVVILASAWVQVRSARSERDAHLATYRWTDHDLSAANHQAISRSHAVVSGKVQEHLAPLFPEFISRFDPREARFLGSPVDYVVFDGLDDGECSVVFVEVKTGRAQLSTRERRVRRAIDAGRVHWVEMRLPEEVTGPAEPPALPPPGQLS